MDRAGILSMILIMCLWAIGMSEHMEIVWGVKVKTNVPRVRTNLGILLRSRIIIVPETDRRKHFKILPWVHKRVSWALFLRDS